MSLTPFRSIKGTDPPSFLNGEDYVVHYNRTHWCGNRKRREAQEEVVLAWRGDGSFFSPQLQQEHRQLLYELIKRHQHDYAHKVLSFIIQRPIHQAAASSTQEIKVRPILLCSLNQNWKVSQRKIEVRGGGIYQMRGSPTIAMEETTAECFRTWARRRNSGPPRAIISYCCQRQAI